MLPRILEPEVMESADEAREYDAMDHAAVNEAFVADFLAAIRAAGLEDRLHHELQPFEALDCGTGTALIPILLARRLIITRIVATDLSREMLKLARRNVQDADLQSCLTLQCEDGKAMRFESDSFDAVISNSLIHHLPEPNLALGEMVRVLRPGGILFVRDLLRPESVSQLDRLVEQHAAGVTVHQRLLFRDSLHAALTVEEVKLMLNKLRVENGRVEQTSDRHWTLTAMRSSVGNR